MNPALVANACAELLAVATARLSPAGKLLEANAGFLRLLEGGSGAGDLVARFFVQPAFAAIAAAAPDGGLAYRGLMTIGAIEGRTRTLRGQVWREAGELHLLAEFDIEELGRINDQVLALNRELTEAQRALAQAHLLLKQREAQIAEVALTDPLTGAGNRRRLEQALAAEIARARRTGGPLCAVMADLDRFKAVNDRHGHAAGDEVLVRFAQILRAQTRATDVVARYGGEEFVVLLPHAGIEQAAVFAERVRRALAAETVAPLPAPVTASFGIAQLREGETGDALLDRADAALYRAKENGRNRVEREAA